MASVSRESIGILHEKIAIKLEKEEFVPAFEKAIKQYSKNANIPGFRKGFVPSGMIRKMYGQALYNEEIVRAAGKQLEEYMQKERLAIFGQPMLINNEEHLGFDMNVPQDINFYFEIGLKPEFEIPALRDKALLTLHKIVVTDKMMDDEVVRIQRRYGTVDTTEEVTNNEQVVYAEYLPCDTQGSVVEGTQKIEDTELLDKMPQQFKERLMGMKTGDNFVFRPVDICTTEELAGFLKSALKAPEDKAEQHYQFTLAKIGMLVPKELGTELYNEVFKGQDIQDEATFRDALRKELSIEFDRIVRQRLQNEIFELLVHTTPIALPVTFLKRWMKEGDEQKKRTDEEVEKEFGAFEHQLRWQLISDKVMQENKLEVTEEDMKQDIRSKLMSHFGLNAAGGEDISWMDAYVKNLLKDEKTGDETYRRLLTDKLFGFLESQFSIQEAEIEEEAFFKLANAHDAHHH